MLTSFFGKSKPINFIVCGLYVLIALLGALWVVPKEEITTYQTLTTLAVLLFLIFSVLLLDFVIRKNALTQTNTYGIFLFVCFIGPLTAIFFEKDIVLIKKKELYYNQLIISSFIEKHISSHINISKDDVRLYYKQNKSSFIRNQDEAQIEQYIMESEKEARKLVRSFGYRKAIDTDRFSIRSTHQDVVKRGTFSKEVDDDIFISFMG